VTDSSRNSAKVTLPRGRKKTESLRKSDVNFGLAGLCGWRVRATRCVAEGPTARSSFVTHVRTLTPGRRARGVHARGRAPRAGFITRVVVARAVHEESQRITLHRRRQPSRSSRLPSRRLLEDAALGDASPWRAAGHGRGSTARRCAPSASTRSRSRARARTACWSCTRAATPFIATARKTFCCARCASTRSRGARTAARRCTRRRSGSCSGSGGYPGRRG